MNKRLSAKPILRAIEALERELLGSATFDYQRRAAIVRESKALLNDANRLFQLPGKGEELREAQRRAAALYREAMNRVYPPGFDDEMERLRAGKASGVEAGIRFLEADPWFDGSGYMKEGVTRWLRRLILSPQQEDRLRRVVLRVFDHPDARREHMYYVRLAIRRR